MQSLCTGNPYVSKRGGGSGTSIPFQWKQTWSSNCAADFYPEVTSWLFIWATFKCPIIYDWSLYSLYWSRNKWKRELRYSEKIKNGGENTSALEESHHKHSRHTSRQSHIFVVDDTECWPVVLYGIHHRGVGVLKQDAPKAQMPHTAFRFAMWMKYFGGMKISSLLRRHLLLFFSCVRQTIVLVNPSFQFSSSRAS